jgi:hypothetical protein
MTDVWISGGCSAPNPDEKRNQKAEVYMAKGEISIPHMVTTRQRKKVDGDGKGKTD